MNLIYQNLFKQRQTNFRPVRDQSKKPGIRQKACRAISKISARVPSGESAELRLLAPRSCKFRQCNVQCLDQPKVHCQTGPLHKKGSIVAMVYSAMGPWPPRATERFLGFKKKRSDLQKKNIIADVVMLNFCANSAGTSATKKKVENAVRWQLTACRGSQGEKRCGPVGDFCWKLGLKERSSQRLQSTKTSKDQIYLHKSAYSLGPV